MAQIGQGNPQDRKPCWADIPAAAFDSISRFVSDLRRRSSFRAEVAELDRTGRLDPLLEDIGVTRWDLNKIARGYPEAERLLPSMAYHLRIDLEKLDPAELYELRHTCAICEAHRACRRWLAAGGGKPGEPCFCPNAALFSALRDRHKETAPRRYS